MTPVVVVGGGISGLSAAWELLAQGHPGEDVVVLEAGERTGGVLARGALPVPGRAEPLLVDLGPESLLTRRPEAVGLVEEVGLGGDVEHPRALGAAVASRGDLHRLPTGTVMGVPRTTRGLLGVLTDAEVARVAAEESVRPVAVDDVDVAGWVAGRVGRAVVDRLVEPLLGGVYAGRAERLSLRTTVPALWSCAVEGTPLVDDAQADGRGTGGASSPTTAGAAAAGPVFAGVRGGVGRLGEELTAALVARGVQVLTRCRATSLRPADGGWEVGVDGPAFPGASLRAAGVVVALPAPAAAALLRDAVPSAAAALADVRTASMAIGTLAVPAAVLDGVDLTGVLVPPVEDRLVKATTFSSRKWGWLEAEGRRPQDGDADPVAVLRVSVGRAGEEHVLHRDDDDLLSGAAADLGALLGRPTEAVPVLAGTVTRWYDGLPQYDVGHAALVEHVLGAVAGTAGLEVAGATYEGVGVPACIASGRAAARRVLAAAAQGSGSIGA